MDATAYKRILDKYFNGTATEDELRLLEQYADNLIGQDDTSVFASDAEKAAIKSELQDRIKIKRTVRFSVWGRVAAGIALIAGVSMILWLMASQFGGMGTQMSVAKTGVGEHKTVQLPDGSIVQMNAMSVLKYPTAFDRSKREVQLNGEAHFEVAKDADRPFIVASNSIHTEVLGTVFNVRAYEFESIVISLLEGSVYVEGAGGGAQLQPMEQAVFHDLNEHPVLQEFDSADVVAWLNRDIVLSRTSFRELQHIIKRRFGTNIRFNKEEIAEYTVSGKFKQPDLKTLLESVCAAKSLEFKETAEGEYLIY